MSERRVVAQALASAFLAGPWTFKGLVERGSEVVGGRAPWVSSLARSAMSFFPRPPHARLELLGEVLASRPAFSRGFSDPSARARIVRWMTSEPQMARQPWPVPSLPTQTDLAAWRGVTRAQLDWLADVPGIERTSSPGRWRRYRYTWIPKRSGGERLLERPGLDLARVQRKVLHGILGRVPPHDAAHGFAAGRSVRSFAEPHSGQAVVVRVDLEDFFFSVRPARIWAVFRTAGYPWERAGPAHAQAAEVCEPDSPRGGLHAARRKDAGDAPADPAAARGRCGERASIRPPRGLRTAEGHPPPVSHARPRESEHRRSS